MNTDDAVQEARRAFDAHRDDPDLGRYMGELGARIWDRWVKRGDPTDLDEAIEWARKAAHAATHDHQRLDHLEVLEKRLYAKYRWSTITDDLQKSIQVARQAADLASKGQDHAKYLDILGSRLFTSYEENTAVNELDTLDESIQVARVAVQKTPDGQDRVKRLHALASRLSEKHADTSVTAHVDEIIDISRAILADIARMPDLVLDYPDRPWFFYALATQLYARYSIKGDRPDLEDAIHAVKNAVAMSDQKLIPVQYLCSLGELCRLKFLKTEAPKDLDEAIRYGTQAVDEAQRMYGQTLLSYAWQELKETLDVAHIREKRAAIAIDLSSFKEQSDEKDGLHIDGRKEDASALDSQYKKRVVERLDQEVETWERIVLIEQKTDPGCHPNNFSERIGESLRALGIRLHKRWNETQSSVDLDTAIHCTRQSIVLMAPSRPKHLERMRDLQGELMARYKRTGDQADLDEALATARAAVEDPLNSNTDVGDLTSLGAKIYARFESMGDIKDLEECLKISQQIVELTPVGHINRAPSLNVLGIRLHERFERTGALEDLDESLRLIREAISLMPEAHWRRSMLLGNLGCMLWDSYHRKEDISELRKAIEASREAASLAFDQRLNRASWLTNLGASLACLYMETDDVSALEEAIQVTREAAVMNSERVPDLIGLLNNLGIQLSYMFAITGITEHLDEAIDVTTRAVDLLPQGHPQLSKILNNLGGYYETRYLRTRATEALDQAVGCHQRALRSTGSVITHRVKAGIEILRLCPNSQEAYDAARLAVSLVPMLTIRSLASSDRQAILGSIVGLGSNAAAAALRVGEAPVVALKLLEQSRGVLSSSLEDIRADLGELQNHYPELAEQFLRLRNHLEGPAGTASFILAGEKHTSSTQNQPSSHYEAGKQFDQLIKDIREKPGFESFLQAPDAAELQGAASAGPVVVVNVSHIRCDAFLVESYRIRSIALPELSEDAIRNMERSNHLGNPRVLKWLWEAVIMPILDALGMTHSPREDDDWPHVWWIATGSLSKFPLHAAGLYHNGLPVDTLLDRAMSSYSSSIKAIINGRRRASTAVPGQALFVAMSQTPGHKPLPFAAAEVEVIRGICQSASLQPSEPQPLKNDVVTQLHRCSVFHFAGHGASDNENPARSLLFLQDWQKEPLTVGDLLNLNLRESSPFLAYLSACDTGSLKNPKYLDESIHLISACQIAGFRHVVGTLWEVSDPFSVEMARMVYQEMAETGFSDRSVCVALHKANRRLRDSRSSRFRDGRQTQYSVGSHDPSIGGATSSEIVVEKDRDDESTRKAVLFSHGGEEDNSGRSLLWVPFVHFGV